MPKLGLLLCAALWAACGCAALKPRPADPGLFLWQPSEAGFSTTLTQAITLQKGATRTEVMAVAEVSPEKVTLAVLGPMGNRVLSLVWDGKKMDEQRDPSLPKDFPASLILRDLQLAFWDETALRKALPAGWSLKADASQRLFSKGSDEVIAIHYDGDRFKDPIQFEHKALGYKLDISELDTNHD